MTSREERLGKLEARMAPPPPPHQMSPAMDLLLTLMQHERDVQDHLASLHNPRLAPVPDPGPLVLTPEQEAESKKGNEEFLEYLEGQRELARGNPVGLESIELAIRMTREEIEQDREDDA